ncbi:MAG: hypothetical protein K0Q79_1922 [Flavipsychrobacter sp.]|jgi:hypothetical protein|nr:hypothetical protein [Flavipsychrobacter sp.]
MKKFIILIFIILARHNSYSQVSPIFHPPVGDAIGWAPGQYNLTPSTPSSCSNQVGAIWSTAATFADFSNSFILEFDASFDSYSGGGADGICVVFGTNILPFTLGNNSAFLGYYQFSGTIFPEFQNSLAVEIDVFSNSGSYLSDISTDHVALCQNANPSPLFGPVPFPGGSTIKDGIFRHYILQWCRKDNELKFFSGTTELIRRTIIPESLFVSTSGTGSIANVPWGFTGSTGSHCSNQIVANVTLQPLPGEEFTCNCVNDVLLINKTSQITTGSTPGGTFAHSEIRAGSSVAAGGDPIVNSPPNNNTLFLGRSIKLEPNFFSTVNTGHYFKALPISTCAPIVPCSISGPHCINLGSFISLTGSPPGGTWSSSSPSVIRTLGVFWGVSLTGSSPAIITYTVGQCSTTHYVEVKESCGSYSPKPSSHENVVVGDLIIAPNPNTGSFTITGSLPSVKISKEATIEVTDLLGKTIYTDVAAIENGNINKVVNLGSDIASGIYMVRIKNPEVNEVIKFTLYR